MRFNSKCILQRAQFATFLKSKKCNLFALIIYRILNYKTINSIVSVIVCIKLIFGVVEDRIAHVKEATMSEKSNGSAVDASG
jgi:hypothetical protein